MSSVNKVILIGRLGSDPELRYSESGNAMASIRMATEETWKKDGEKQSRTEWHTVKAFGRLAEIIGEFLVKGSQAYIEGRISTRKWKDKEGNDRYSTEIIADQMRMLGGKSTTAKKEGKAKEPTGADDDAPAQAEFDDDIPF